MRKLRGAIVGFGRVAAEAHLPGFEAAAGFEILAVVDSAPESREQALRRLPAAHVYASLEELAAGEPKLEFVDIATPPRFHAPLALEALERGWHVLCEKPLATSSAEIGDLRRAARRINRALYTVHNWKWAPLLRRLRGLVVAGTIGEPVKVEWTVLRPEPPVGASGESWRLDPAFAGAGILMDHGWHAFYLMLYLTAREPRSVAAETRRERGLAVEDNAECTIDFGDLEAKIRLSWTASERKTAGSVRGTLGVIEVDDDTLVVRVDDRPEERTRFAPPLSASSYHPEWFPALLEDFRAEVLHPDRRGRNLAEAVRCAELVAAAYASEGRAVPLQIGAQEG